MELIERPEQLRPGDLMFGPIKGLVGAGIGAAQVILATAEPGMVWEQGIGEWWNKRHCGIIVEASKELPPGSWYRNQQYSTGVITCPRLVQAMPGGVEEIDLTYEKWNPDYIYIRPRYGTRSWGMNARDQADVVAKAARSFVGTPYDFLTYGAIPAYRRGIRTERIKRIISDTDTMMCSRTVDAALAAASWHLFNDKRLPGDVTPSELYRQVRSMPIAAMSDIEISLGSL